MDLNMVLLCGRVAAPPEPTVMSEGAHLLRTLVTVRCDQPRRRIDVLPVSLWDPDPWLAELTPGQRVWLVGSVERRFQEYPWGRRSRIEILAKHIRLDQHMSNQRTEGEHLGTESLPGAE